MTWDKRSSVPSRGKRPGRGITGQGPPAGGEGQTRPSHMVDVSSTTYRIYIQAAPEQVWQPFGDRAYMDAIGDTKDPVKDLPVKWQQGSTYDMAPTGWSRRQSSRRSDPRTRSSPASDLHLARHHGSGRLAHWIACSAVIWRERPAAWREQHRREPRRPTVQRG